MNKEASSVCRCWGTADKFSFLAAAEKLNIKVIKNDTEGEKYCFKEQFCHTSKLCSRDNNPRVCDDPSGPAEHFQASPTRNFSTSGGPKSLKRLLLSTSGDADLSK